MQSGVKAQGPQGYEHSVQSPCSFADRVSALTGLRWDEIPAAYCIKTDHRGPFNSLLDPSACCVFHLHYIFL